MSERLEALEDLLKLHPQGTHFCITTQQSGYALDAEFLQDVCDAVKDCRNAFESIKWSTRYEDGSRDYAQIDRSLVEKAMEKLK